MGSAGPSSFLTSITVGEKKIYEGQKRKPTPSNVTMINGYQLLVHRFEFHIRGIKSFFLESMRKRRLWRNNSTSFQYGEFKIEENVIVRLSHHSDDVGKTFKRTQDEWETTHYNSAVSCEFMLFHFEACCFRCLLPIVSAACIVFASWLHCSAGICDSGWIVCSCCTSSIFVVSAGICFCCYSILLLREDLSRNLELTESTPIVPADYVSAGHDEVVDLSLSLGSSSKRSSDGASTSRTVSSGGSFDSERKRKMENFGRYPHTLYNSHGRFPKPFDKHCLDIVTKKKR
ncbi:hypothetical protein Tco_0355238 [Tanacetum coccineum]